MRHRFCYWKFRSICKWFVFFSIWLPSGLLVAEPVVEMPPQQGELTVESVRTPADIGGLSVSFGAMNDCFRFGVNYETPVLWSHDFENWLGRVDLFVEAGVAYWQTHGESPRDELWQFSAIPILRWWVYDPFFIEGGVGPTIINHSSFSGRRLSTAFQFGDHIGCGVALSDNLRLSIRFAHFSNAGIKRPNSGLNILLLTIGHDF